MVRTTHEAIAAGPLFDLLTPPRNDARAVAEGASFPEYLREPRDRPTDREASRFETPPRPSETARRSDADRSDRPQRTNESKDGAPSSEARPARDTGADAPPTPTSDSMSQNNPDGKPKGEEPPGEAARGPGKPKEPNGETIVEAEAPPFDAFAEASPEEASVDTAQTSQNEASVPVVVEQPIHESVSKLDAAESEDDTTPRAITAVDLIEKPPLVADPAPDDGVTANGVTASPGGPRIVEFENTATTPDRASLAQSAAIPTEEATSDVGESAAAAASLVDDDGSRPLRRTAAESTDSPDPAPPRASQRGGPRNFGETQHQAQTPTAGQRTAGDVAEVTAARGVPPGRNVAPPQVVPGAQPAIHHPAPSDSSPVRTTPAAGEVGGASATDRTTTNPTKKSDETPRPISTHDRVRFTQRVARAVRVASNADGHVRLRLHPPELGSLRLDVSVKDGAVVAHLEAETAAARSLLLENLPQLRERLAAEDIRVDQFQVDVMDHREGDGSPGPHRRDADDPAGRRYQSDNTTDANQPSNPSPRRSGHGALAGIDLLA